MGTLLQDLRYGARMLARTPGATLVSVVSVALGVGATTVIFTLVNALLLRPLPVADPGSLVTVAELRSGNVVQVMSQTAVSPERWRAFREAGGSVLSGLAAHRYDEFSLRSGGEASVLNGVLATANYFEVLGLRPAAGRFFSEAQDADGTAPVAVLSHALWQREFGGSPGVVGRTVSVDSREMTVVGVAPAGFGGILAGLPVDVWVPEAAYRRGAPAAEAAGGTSWLAMVGRLRPGVSREQARAALEVIARRVPPEQEGTTIRGVRVDAHSGVPAEMRGMLAGFLGMLLATAGLVLLIACTNVAGMGVARAVARRRETAIRLAIGAGRGRLVRQLVTETVLLFLLGGAAGLLLALWLADLLSAFRPPVPVQVAFDLGVDWRVFGFAMALALGTGVVFGLVPALGASRPDLVPALKEGREAPGRRSRLRGGFVVAQLAMSLLLLVTAGLFVRTLRSALAEDLGFDPDGVVVAQLGLSAHGYDAAGAGELYGRLRERLEADPGVRSVSAARFAPMGGNVMATTIEPQDVRPGGRGEPVAVGLDPVAPGYFETLRIPVLAGRAFTGRDAAGAAPVAVVNQALAARLWPGESPLGRRVRVDGTLREVVGVARNAKYEGYRDEREAHLYLPLAQDGSANLTVIVRSRGGAAGGLEAIRRELRALDPDVALREASPLPALVGLSLFPQRLAASFIGVFGAVGLLLAAVGLYGILAHGVAQRRREIGVRIALGARAGDVLRMVVRSGLVLTAVGIAVGLAAALALTRLLSGMLYGVTATDPVTFAAVPLLLLGVALLASYLPARRATRVDPMVALRAD